MGAGKAKRWKANRQLLRKRLLAISLALCVHVIVTLMLSPSCACISAHSIALAFTLAAEILCYRAMASLAKPSYAHNELVDGGVDLRQDTYHQDVIYVTIACHILTLISRWFWLLWLSIPGFAAYKLYFSFVSPFSPSVLQRKHRSAPVEEEDLPVKKKSQAKQRQAETSVTSSRQKPNKR